MSGVYRFKREAALPHAQTLLELLRPGCEQIEIAGSLRRGLATVGDIELVAQPKIEEQVTAGQLGLFGDNTAATIEHINWLDRRLDQLGMAGDIHRDRPFTHQKGRWGDKMKTFWVALKTGDYIQVDLFIVTPPAQWGSIFTIRTGPGEFGKALMLYINSRTLLKQEDGYLRYRGTGEIVPTPTEVSYFEALGLRWIAPADRCAAALKRTIPRNGASKAKPQPPVRNRHNMDDEAVRAYIRQRLEAAAGIEV